MTGPASTITAPARCLVADWNEGSMSFARRTSRYWICTLSAPPASSSSFNASALPSSVELPRTATRESAGTISFSNSSCFPLISGAREDNQVMFPPGRARLTTTPDPTGSPSKLITIGTLVVACLAARVGVGPYETRTSIWRLTSSAASAGRRSGFPSAERHSMMMFFPST